MADQAELLAQGEQYIPDGYDPDLYRIRHSAAHILAQAVLERFPGALVAIGPPVENGFYYDFGLPRQPTDEDLAWVEDRMKEIIRGRHPFTVREVSADEAREIFAGQPFKLELIDDLAKGRVADPSDADGEGTSSPAEAGTGGSSGANGGGRSVPITIYQQDTFTDLCRGPHVRTTGDVPHNAVKLMSVSGAYWRGDEKQASLYRIYGTAWRNKGELADYLKRLEEAKKRDHRRLGRELKIFTTSDLIGAGLPLWLPNGAVIRRELETYILAEERRAGYLHVYTPNMGKKELYETSGHWQHYQDNMFPPIQMEHETLVLRPMNCPHHMLIYGSETRSYRDLPLRVAELGTMYRYERSGVVGGLSRVRTMTLNDAHLFCTPEQVRDEFATVIRMVERAYATLGITEYRYRLSLREKGSDKYHGDDAMWAMAESALREVLDELGVDYFAAEGEAAFYGPKVDIQIRDVMGREETMSTVQLDFLLPSRFGLTYVGEDNQPHTPVVIHRGVISTMERMTAYLIELYAGAFPAWLAPLQAVALPIADRHAEFAESVAARLVQAGFRAQADTSSKSLNARIREAQLQKVPYILVLGDREVESGTVTVRLRTGENLPAMSVDEFEALLRRQVETRSLQLT